MLKNGCSHKGRNNYEQGIRYIEDMTILFYSKESVYIQLKNQTVVVVHRWGDMRKGLYAKTWKPFLEKLKRSSKLGGIYGIIRLANEYELGVICTGKMPEIANNIKQY